MKADEFDTAFDEGEDVTGSLDTAQAHRPNWNTSDVRLECPEWMIDQLDREAQRLKVSRQALIKIWLAERLEHTHTRA